MKSVITRVILAAALMTCSALAQGPVKWVDPPPTALIRQIQSDFLQLSQPLNFSFYTEDDWSGIDRLQQAFGVRPEKATRIKLRGDVKEFVEKYSPGEIGASLYPFLKDENQDAEASIILSAMVRTNVRVSDFATSFKSRSKPGDWAEKRRTLIRYAEADVDQLTEGFIGGWDPRPPHYKVPPDQVLPSSLKKKVPARPLAQPTAPATAKPSARSMK